jgi:glycyl-tRNA synthetase
LDTLLAEKGISAELVDEYKTVQAQADAYSLHEMAQVLKKYNCKAPDTGNELTYPKPFNLMFETSIGPTGQFRG